MIYNFSLKLMPYMPLLSILAIRKFRDRGH